MAPPTWTQTIDNVFTTTWAQRRPGAIEQNYLKTPFIFWLKARDRVKEVRGFRRLEIPVEYGKNETAAWITKGGSVSLTEGELVTIAYDEWKYLAVTIMRFGTEDQINRGAAKLIDYVKLKLNAAERAIWDEFERVTFADGSGADEPNGLQNLVADSPSTGTVHNLNRATYTWWRNTVKASTGAASVYLISDMRNIMNTLTTFTKSEIKDMFLMTDQTTFELYEDEMLEMKQIVNSQMGDAGFDTLNFKGRPIMWAPSAPSGSMYFLNPNFLNLVIDPDYFMEMTEWKPIPDQVNDRVAQIVSALNFTVSRPVAQGVLTGIAA